MRYVCMDDKDNCYELAESLTIGTKVRGRYVKHEYFTLFGNGTLIIKKGYQWNGANVAIDTREWIKASLVHDCGYQMIEEGMISCKHRKAFDKLMYKLLRENGMSWFRAKYSYRLVRIFGRLATGK